METKLRMGLAGLTILALLGTIVGFAWATSGGAEATPAAMPLGDQPGLLRFHVDNRGDAFHGTLTVTDGQGTTLWSASKDFAADRITDVDVRLPVATYGAALRVAMGEGSATVSDEAAALAGCPTPAVAVQMKASLHDGGGFVQGDPTRCMDGSHYAAPRTADRSAPPTSPANASQPAASRSQRVSGTASVTAADYSSCESCWLWITADSKDVEFDVASGASRIALDAHWTPSSATSSKLAVFLSRDSKDGTSEDLTWTVGESAAHLALDKVPAGHYRVRVAPSDRAGLAIEQDVSLEGVVEYSR